MQIYTFLLKKRVFFYFFYNIKKQLALRQTGSLPQNKTSHQNKLNKPGDTTQMPYLRVYHQILLFNTQLAISDINLILTNRISSSV